MPVWDYNCMHVLLAGVSDFYFLCFMSCIGSIKGRA